jgi:2'-5' RNA ligase
MTLINPSKQRFFIALLPPDEVQEVANKIKEDFAQTYHSKAAKKSPPHITLQPPFEWENHQLEFLIEALNHFSKTQTVIPISLEGFGAFKPRVIYINVIFHPALISLQKELSDYLKTNCNIIHPVANSRPFHPHLTVAFRDLKKSAFQAAWKIYQHQSISFQFTVSHLTLLLHNGQRWEIFHSFPFQAESISLF